MFGSGSSRLGILNSKFANFLLKENAFSKKDTFPQIRLHWLKEFPIPKKAHNKEIKPLVINIQEYYKSYFSLVNKFVKFFSAQLNFTHSSNKLQNWYELEFSDFIKELNNSIKNSGAEKLSKSVEMEWMELFQAKKSEAQILKAEIEKTDKEINRMVYELYGLTEEEIKIVEEAL